MASRFVAREGASRRGPTRLRILTTSAGSRKKKVGNALRPLERPEQAQLPRDFRGPRSPTGIGHSLDTENDLGGPTRYNIHPQPSPPPAGRRPGPLSERERI